MTKQIAPQDQIKNTLTQMIPQFQAALPPHIAPEKFVRVAQTAILTDPSIAKLERNSLFKVCIEAAQDGLLPNGKEGAIVPFGNKATWMPMVAGVLKKVRNSGEIASITAQIVHENDEFDFWIDENGENIKHRPNLFKPRGAEIATYAMAKLKDGSLYIEVLTNEDIKAIQNCSRGNGGPWKTFPGEMKKKSAIRRLAKRLPMSTDVENTLQKDDKYYDFDKEKKIVNVENTNEAPQLTELENLVTDGDTGAKIPENETGKMPDIEVL